MKTLATLTATALAAIALAGCEQKSAEASKADGMMDQMPMGGGMMKDGMDMPAGAKMAKGAGVVTAIDKENGAITVDHQPIPEAGWPAMTMAFKAGSPQMLDQVKVGDTIAFDLKLEGGAGEITAIRTQ